MAGLRVISIMNQKGGVGKTTTTLNLGAALAHRGKRVLLVDLDPQANLTLGLGHRAADLSESVYELLTEQKPDAARLVIQTKWERLHLIPSHIDLSGADIEMMTMIGRESKLTKALDPIRANYDYILIDCLPSLTLLTVNAMAASTEVFVPLQAHPFALEGLGKLFEVVSMVREAMNPVLRVSGVLVTMFDGRTNVARTTLDILRGDDRLKEHIFTTTVKQNIRIAESQKDGVPVMYLDASCHATKAYQAMCEEVLEMEKGTLASHCAAIITQREEHLVPKHRTFTPDLLAPLLKPVALVTSTETASVATQATATHAEEKTPRNHSESVPATSESHTAPVSALVNSPVAEVVAEPAPPVMPVEPVTPPAQTQASTPAPVYPPNSPDAETLHPSTGARFAISASVTAASGDPTALIQAAQSGVHFQHYSSSENHDDRPRLRTSESGRH